MSGSLRVRRSISDVLTDYFEGEKEPLDKLIRAWHGIQQLSPDDENSFFKIAGYHGEPFRGAGWGNAAWWGGYCNHGNVLFPTWHRAYILRIEDALRSIAGCEDVTLPYWNEVGAETMLYGVPRIFLQKRYIFEDKSEIDNPLYSYKFQKPIFDNLGSFPDADYSKPEDYRTIRYPFSGLVGPSDIEKTQVYNAELEVLGNQATDKMLNENVQSWLNEFIQNSDGQTILTHTSWKYRHCLGAPNYTVFSNATSATQWNEDKFGVKKWDPSKQDKIPELVVPLESPHNDMHLAIGGFNLPGKNNANSPEAWNANGDMGENDTAGFDPIFFFHHCFIDKVFWTWQQITENTEKLEIIDQYPGTNSVDSQGPTPGVPGNVWLTMQTPLNPFKNKDGITLTSEDLVDIEKQLGYQYAQPGPLLLGIDKLVWDKPIFKFPNPSIDGHSNRPKAPQSQISLSTPIVQISGVNRASISGSFTLDVLDKNGKLLGVESILSRWNVVGCANCQTHLNVKAFLPLFGLKGSEDINVVVRGRNQKQLPDSHEGLAHLPKPKFDFVHRGLSSRSTIVTQRQ